MSKDRLGQEEKAWIKARGQVSQKNLGKKPRHDFEYAIRIISF